MIEYFVYWERICGFGEREREREYDPPAGHTRSKEERKNEGEKCFYGIVAA